jgi:predicted transcriptional regulator
MQINVLLSIKPKFAAAIFSGEKQYEFRRAIFKNKNVKKVYVYASKPIGLVIGEFDIEEIITENPDLLWSMTKDASGISKEYYDEYFEGKLVAHAIKVTSVNKYAEPATLMELFHVNRPPQSFMYVSEIS